MLVHNLPLLRLYGTGALGPINWSIIIRPHRPLTQ